MSGKPLLSVLLLVSASCSTETPSGVCDTGKCDQAGEIKLDASFQAFRYAERLDAPTAMAFGRDHRLYVALQGGDIVSLGDLDGDGKAEDRRAVASGFDTPSGLAFRPGTDDLYVGRKGGVDKIVGGAKSVVVDGFPNGEHSTDDVEFGPDGKLYISNGSVDDHNETNSNAMTQAAILRVDADGQNLMRFASGTRNPYGLAFDSAGRLWASDNGGDVPEGQPDELNLIEEGKDYGWPGCFGTDTAGACSTKTPARANLEVHSSQDGLTVYEHIAFPSHFRGGIFVVSWGGAVPGFEGAGHKLTFVADPAGAATVEPFATGFEHPLDVKVDPADGTLVVADWGKGVIYKIAAKNTAALPDATVGTASERCAAVSGGVFCGDDGIGGGVSDGLYQCSAAHVLVAATRCVAGCQTMPAGVSDACK